MEGAMNESQQMVEEAYAAIAAVHSIPLVRVKRVADNPNLVSAAQMLAMGLITQRKYMEILEEAVFPPIWIEP
jgi:hypothetical protein